MIDLSKEELLKIINEQNKKISNLERDFYDLQEKYNELLKKLENKLHVIKVNNHNKFYSKVEKAFNDENKEDTQ